MIGPKSSDRGSGGLFVARPSLAAWGRSVPFVGPLAIVIVTLLLAVQWFSTGLVNGRLLAIFLAGIGLGAVMLAYFRNSRIEVERGELRVFGFTGRARVWPRGSVRRCQGLLVMFPVIGVTKKLLIGLDSTGRTLFRLEAGLWDVGTLDSIAGALGTSSLGWQSLSKKEAMRTYPGALSFVDQHNWLAGCAIPLLAIVLAFVLAPFVMR